MTRNSQSQLTHWADNNIANYYLFMIKAKERIILASQGTDTQL